MFAVKRGKIGKRVDVGYNKPHYMNFIDGNYVPLGQYITAIDTGKNYPQVEPSCNTVGLIRTQNIRPVYADMSTISHIPKTTAKHLTEQNDLMFVRVGVGVGDCCVVDNSSSGCAFSDNTLRVKVHTINPEFISIWISLGIGKALLVSSAKGSGKAVISGESIRNILIPNIAFSEQERLSNEYRKAFNKRTAKLREADELLAEIDKLLLERLGIGEISVKSRITSAVTLGTIKTEKTVGAEYYHPERLTVIRAIENNPAVSTRKLADIVDFLRDTVSADNQSYLGLAGVVSNTGELSGAKEEAEGQAFSYRAGDVLYARLRPYLNKVLFAETDGVCSTEFHVMRVNCSDVLPEYLTAIMRSKIIVAQTKHMMTGNTHPRISNDDVRNLRIPVPSKDIQRTIINEMRNRIERSRLLKREAETEWTAAKGRFERELMGN